MDNQRRRQLREQYKQRTMLGGVYRIRNTVTGHFYMDWDEDLAGVENRHAFSVKTNTCILPGMVADWKAHGAASFVFECLEELEMQPEQSREEFHSDLATLLELWQEKTDMQSSYKK